MLYMVIGETFYRDLEVISNLNKLFTKEHTTRYMKGLRKWDYL
jgi:hypothetical protein